MLINGDSKQILQQYEDNKFDLIVTDPPYGISFMGKDWDKALPDIEVWQQCYRVLKEGKFAFIMCSPRQDVLSRMIINLEDVGFRTNYTSIYWTYASGFPKAANISKLIDKKFKVKDDYKTNMEPYIEFSKYLKENRIKQNKSLNDLARLFPSKTGGLTGIIWNWENIGRTNIRIPTPEQYNILKTELNLDDSFDELVYNEREAIRKWEEAEREIIGKSKTGYSEIMGSKVEGKGNGLGNEVLKYNITKPATPEAKKMEGAYVGFQPKPAVEVILVVSKGKSLTWLDDCRIPYSSDADRDGAKYGAKTGLYSIRKMQIDQGDRHNLDVLKRSGEQIIKSADEPNQKGRFPANLLCSDDILNDGKITKSKAQLMKPDPPKDDRGTWQMHPRTEAMIRGHNDSGSYSRYFSLDSWSKTFPFLICPKASKAERNKGCEDLPEQFAPKGNNEGRDMNNPNNHLGGMQSSKMSNFHPTVKPLKLMSYLVTLGSREGDTVLDPFCGSGTTCIAAQTLHRDYVGIEINEEYYKIAQARLVPYLSQTKLV